MNIDSTLADKLCWHKTVLFPSVSVGKFAKMNDEVLRNFATATSKALNKGSDKRKAMCAELEEWEKENGQDALYWSMKVDFDREVLIAAKMVIDHQTAIELIRERIVANAEWRWLKSHLDDIDDDIDNEDF